MHPNASFRADAAGLLASAELIDRPAGTHQPRPDPRTRDKIDPAAFAGMPGAIRHEVEVTAIRGTSRLSRNKGASAIAGLRSRGNAAPAEAMESVA